MIRYSMINVGLRRAARASAGAGALLALAACGTVPREPASRDIGPPPALLSEVAAPAWRAGEHALVIARREEMKRLEANWRLCSGREEWKKMRVDLLGDSAAKLSADQRPDFSACDAQLRAPTAKKRGR